MYGSQNRTWRGTDDASPGATGHFMSPAREVDPCQQIAVQMGSMFTCTQLNDCTRIRTPFLYPDGDIIDLFLQYKDGQFTLTDLGETIRWLKMQTLAPKRSPKQNQLIQDVCLTNGVELFRGMLVARLHGGIDALSQAVARLAQACLRTADIWFTYRTRSLTSITDEVADLLQERNVPFERAVPLPGRSGRIWKPDFHTRTASNSSLVNVLATGSRAAARGIAEHVLSNWFDLSHLKVGPEAMTFISLFDDTMDVWEDQDFNLVGEVSTIVLWSRPDEFLEKIAA